MKESYSLEEYLSSAERIRHAQRFAYAKHTGQFRKDGKTPYTNHPRDVAETVFRHESSTADMVAAAWLHDVVEDCGVTVAEIKLEFGDEVAKLVDWLTNKTHGLKLPRAECKKLDRQRLAKAPFEAKLIKLIDRQDNICDLYQFDRKFRKTYALESIALVELLRSADDCIANSIISRANQYIGK